MKKLFEEPKIEVELFAVEDVITASGTLNPVNDQEEDETIKTVNIF